MKNIMKLLRIGSAFLFLFCSLFAQAEITVIKAEKGKAVIQFDSSESLKKGDKVRATDGANEALIIVSKVKGNKGVGKVKTGEAKKGMKATKMDSSKTKSTTAKTSRESEGLGAAFLGKKKLRWGAFAGINMSTMQVKLTSGATTNTADMTGTSFGLKGFGEIPVGSNLWIRGGLGYEMIDVKGTITDPLCQVNTTACVAQLPFMEIDGIGGWNFFTGKFKMNAFGGAGLLFPMSPVTNALDTGSIKQSASIKFGVGMSFGRKIAYPVELEYNMLPASADVKTSFIQIRGGFSF